MCFSCEPQTSFLSTPSARRATQRKHRTRQAVYISIHALREEGDACASWDTVTCFVFLSTPSAGRATMQRARLPSGQRISIHALRGEGDFPIHSLNFFIGISIHALRGEGDTRILRGSGAAMNFYPRPPRGGRLASLGGLLTVQLFLSTPSARRATMSSSFFSSVMEFLSTPSARRATLTSSSQKTVQMIFLSTPSARRATSTARSLLPGTSDFYPRPPRGGRHRRAIYVHLLRDFYPRPPRGGRHSNGKADSSSE